MSLKKINTKINRTRKKQILINHKKKKENSNIYLQKGGSNVLKGIYDKIFKDGAENTLIEDFKDYYKTKIKRDITEFDLVGNSMSGKAYNLEDPYKNIDTITEEGLKTIHKQNLENYFQKQETKEILYTRIHGTVFRKQTEYFRVPYHTVICILADLKTFSSIFESNNIFYSGNKKNTEIFDSVFDYLANMSEDANFEFKYKTSKFYNFIIPDFACVNMFRNSNWFFPGQICYNSYFTAQRKLYKKEGIKITNIKKKSRLNKEQKLEEYLSYQDNSESIKKFYQKNREETDIFVTNLKKLCFTPTTGKRIIIIESCQGISLNYNVFPRVELVKLKRFIFLQHQMNLQISRLRKPDDDESYKYFCYSQPYKSVLILNRISAQLSYEGFPSIGDYSKERKTILEIIDAYNTTETLDHNPNYAEFLKYLNFKEMIDICSEIDPEKLESFSEKYITEEFFLNNKYIFTFYNMYYSFSKKGHNIRYIDLQKIFLGRLSEIGKLQEYLNRYPDTAAEYQIIKEYTQLEQKKMTVGTTLPGERDYLYLALIKDNEKYTIIEFIEFQTLLKDHFPEFTSVFMDPKEIVLKNL